MDGGALAAIHGRCYRWEVRRSAKILFGLGVAAAGYLIILLIAGVVAGGLVAGRIQGRLAQGLDADARVGRAKVNLVTGAVEVSDVSVTRQKLDLLSLSVRSLDVELAPLGLVVVDREPRRVRVRGGRMVVTGAGALQLPPRAETAPIHVGALELDDVALDLMATGYWPGLARVVITIEHARSGPTTLRTGLSWLFTLEDLVARVDLPAGMTLRLGFHDGQLSASGGFFGKTPVTIPFVLPRLDAANEVQQLIAIGTELAKRLAIERAERWIGEQLGK